MKIRHRTVVLDTNVLVLLIIGHADRSLIGRAKRVQQFAPEDFDVLIDFLERFDRIIVTPNILTEADNLARQLPTSRHRELAVGTRELIGQLVDERYHSAASIANLPEFERLGLADGSVLSITDAVVLSDDWALVQALDRRGAQSINFNHLRSWFRPTA